MRNIDTSHAQNEIQSEKSGLGLATFGGGDMTAKRAASAVHDISGESTMRGRIPG